MDGKDGIQTFLSLRKLTRAIADALRAEMMEYLSTLTPLLRPKAVLGDYVQGGAKEPARRADKAFKELQGLYESVATVAPFNLPRELKPPIEVSSMGLEVIPFEYPHVAHANGGNKTIMVRSPLTWVLTYSGFPLARLRELLQSKNRAGDELQKLQQSVLSCLAIHVVMTNQPGVAHMLEALHFPVGTTKAAEFGELPITRIQAAVSTSRPADEMIVQSADMAGVDAFEEVVNVDDIASLRDPQQARLMEVVQTHAPELARAHR